MRINTTYQPIGPSGTPIRENRGYRPLFTPPLPEKRTISAGDRVFVRLTMNTGESMEFYVTTANGMSELIGEVRRRARHLRGLGKVWIRNTSWGWATERPLKLYGSAWPSGLRQGQPGVRTPGSATTPRVRNLGPWDVH